VPEQAEIFMNIDCDIICHEQLLEESEQDNTAVDDKEVENHDETTPLEVLAGLQIRWLRNSFRRFPVVIKSTIQLLKLKKKLIKNV
jgi:hypothetical protein